MQALRKWRWLVFVTVLVVVLNFSALVAAETTATTTTTTTTTSTSDLSATSPSTSTQVQNQTTVTVQAGDEDEEKDEDKDDEQEREQARQQLMKRLREKFYEKMERKMEKLKEKMSEWKKIKLDDEEKEEEEVSEDAAKAAQARIRVQAELDKAMKVLADNPSDVHAKEAVLRAHIRLEALVQDGKNWQAAVDLAKSILEQDPTSEVAVVVTAKDLYDKGNVEAAVQLLKDFVAQKPGKRDEALEKMGEMLEQMGNLDEAKTALEESVSLKPEDLKLYEKLGEVFKKKGEEKLRVFVKGKQPKWPVGEDGKPALPIIIEGRTMVPFRAIGDALGAKVDWDAQNKVVIAVRNGIKVEIPIGSVTIRVNGVDIKIDVPAQIVNGRALIPARALSEALKANVQWDPTYKMVIILDQAAGTTTTTTTTTAPAQ